MKDLLFIWQGDLSGNRLNWIIQRARSAPSSERNAWSELVHNNTKDHDALRYAAQTPDALYYRPLRQRFFRLLAEQGDGSNFAVRMRSWMEQTTDVDALHDYARTALDFNHKPLAKETYRRIVSLDPQNKYALNQLGTLQFTVGQFTSSEQLLTRAVSLPAASNQLQDIQADAQAHFFRAELLKRNGKNTEARREYTRVIDLEQQAAAMAGGLSSDGKARLFSSLFHVGRHKEGMRGFDSMLRENPYDRSTLADYLSVLIEYDFISEAMAISNKYDPKGRRLDQLSSRMERFDKQHARPHASAWDENGTIVEGKNGLAVRYIPTSNTSYQFARGKETGVSQEVAQARQQELRLQLLYARIEQETGQDERARQRLKQLARYYPNEPQLMAYQANVERTNGNPIGALRILEQARALAPENEDFGVLEREIRRTQNTNFARADHEHRSFGQQNEHITTLSGATRVTDRTELGFVAQNNAMRTKNFRNRNSGAIGTFDTTRQNAELYAAYYYENGARLKGSFFTNNDTPGFGATYAFNNDFGRSELVAEYHRPYTDFVEAVFEHTVRDRVGMRHSASITPSLSFGVEAFMNRYNTHLAKDVTKSGLVRANLVYALRHQQPYLGVGYGFDGEYLFGKQKFRLDQFNNVYKLLPLVSREVHALTGILQHDLTKTTHLSLFGGWTVDRLGEEGPVIEGRLTQDLTDSLEAGIRARYGRQANESDNNATHLGAHVQYKF